MEVRSFYEAVPKPYLVCFLFTLVIVCSSFADARSRELFGPEVAKLVGGPRDYTPLYARALRLRAAILRGDFRVAGKTLDESLNRSRIGMFHFEPFPALLQAASPTGDTSYLKELNTWIARDPKDAVAYVLRAEYEFDTGWAIRGAHFNNKLEPNRAKMFNRDLGQANTDIYHALRLNDNNPYSWDLALWILKSVGSQAQLHYVFRQAIRKFPNYYPLYKVRLTALEPKWGGSRREMYAFLAKYAATAPRYSRLKMLYVQTYAELLDTASIDCMQAVRGHRARCVASQMSHLVTKALKHKANVVLSIYHHTTHQYAFIEALGWNLSGMIYTPGGGRYAGTFLEAAARRLDTDNELTPDNTAKNVYKIDALTGDVWYHQQRYDNAGTMYQRAIKDLPHTRFPTREAHDQVLSNLYNDVASDADKRNQYKKAIAYDRAANILVGDPHPGEDRRVCRDLVNLKHYHVMLHECPVSLRPGGDAQIAYWRGLAYQRLGQKEKAIRYYRFVANSESNFRSYAAINMTCLYPANKKGWRQMLKTLNTYKYLYSPNEDGKNSTAIAYNNRCYAEMHLGMLQAALKDCNASLRYGNLPDAFEKQKKIIRRLREKERLAK